MDKEVEEMVAKCDACVNNSPEPQSAILHPWESASRPWSRIHIDHLGPFMGKLFLVVVDSYSKWVDAYPVASTAAETMPPA